MRPTGASHVDTVSMGKAKVASRIVFARGLTVTVLGGDLAFCLVEEPCVRRLDFAFAQQPDRVDPSLLNHVPCTKCNIRIIST
jgi:hypothetical protein